MKNVILIAHVDSFSLKISIFEMQNTKIKNKIYNIFLEKTTIQWYFISIKIVNLLQILMVMILRE